MYLPLQIMSTVEYLPGMDAVVHLKLQNNVHSFHSFVKKSPFNVFHSNALLLNCCHMTELLKQIIWIYICYKNTLIWFSNKHSKI